MDEIFRISDRVTVLRDGNLITTLLTNKTNKEELITNMVGRSIDQEFPKRECCNGEAILELRIFAERVF